MDSNSEHPLVPHPVPLSKEFSAPAVISLQQKSVSGGLELLYGEEDAIDLIDEFVNDSLPRVIIVRPAERVIDSVSREEMEEERHSFMRGFSTMQA